MHICKIWMLPETVKQSKMGGFKSKAKTVLSMALLALPMDSGIYSLDTAHLCRWQILLGFQTMLVGLMEGFYCEVEEQQLFKQKRCSRAWERHCCEASGNKSILLSDSICCCRWTRSSTYSNHPTVHMKLNVAVDLNPISQIPNTRTRFRKLMKVCFLQFWNCFSQSVNSFPQVMKWDEGKQVKESIQQRAGTPQPQTTISKRVIKKELNEFNS